MTLQNTVNAAFFAWIYLSQFSQIEYDRKNRFGGNKIIDIQLIVRFIIYPATYDLFI